MRRGVYVATLAALVGLGAAAPVMTVDDCIRLALERAPAVHGAMADVDGALAQVSAARAAYWPRIIGQAQYGHSEGYDTAITNGGVTQLGVAVEAPILDGGKRVAELAAARARLRSSAAIEQQRRADIAFAVRNTYSTALAFHSESDIRTEAVRVLTNYLDLLRRQEQLGLVPVGDAVRAELALQTARSAERAAVAGLDAALHELGVLVGSPVPASALIEPDAAALAPADDEAIERSPAVLDARAAADAARSDADAVRSENRGRLTLSGDAGFLGVNPAPTFRDNGGGEFLVAVSIPLFDGGAVAARVAAATAATARADAKVDQERETLMISLAHLRADAERARTDMDAWSSALPAAAEAFLLLRARYLGGGSTRLLDVLDALNQSIDARLAVVRARFAYRVAAASHAEALGRIAP